MQPRAEIRRMRPYSPPIEERQGFLRMDFNENSVGCSPKVVEAIKKLNPEDYSVYPEYGSLRKRLARYLKVKPEQVLLSNGSDEAIKCIMDTFISKGDEVIISVPTFAMFGIYARIAGAKIIKVNFNKDLMFPAARVLGILNKRTKLIILPNPNNPTGTKIERSDIIRITEKAKEALILVDEAYYQFMKESSLNLIKKYKNLIVIQTFSKAFGLAGLRIGYAVSCKKNIENMSKAISPYSVNRLAVIAASAALSDLDYVKDYVAEIEKSKKQLCEAVKGIGIKTYPSSANFMLLDFGGKCRLVCRKLREKGILVRDRSNDPLLKGHIRITLGTERQTKRLIKALKGIVRQI